MILAAPAFAPAAGIGAGQPAAQHRRRRHRASSPSRRRHRRGRHICPDRRRRRRPRLPPECAPALRARRAPCSLVVAARVQFGGVDAAQPHPGGHLHARPDAHPRLEGVAVDDAQHLGRMAAAPGRRPGRRIGRGRRRARQPARTSHWRRGRRQNRRPPAADAAARGTNRFGHCEHNPKLIADGRFAQAQSWVVS